MTQNDEQRIVFLIETWSAPKITWGAVMDAIQNKLGAGWTYPTLTKRAVIVEAFEKAKSRHKGKLNTERKADDAEIERLKAMLDFRDEEIKRIKEILARYDERFARYVYNAHALANLTPEALDAPLSDLGRSGR